MDTDTTTDERAADSGRVAGTPRIVTALLATLKRDGVHTRRLRGLGLAALLAFMSGAACRDPGAPVPALGSVSLAWSIADLGRLPTTCDRVGATTVVLLMRNRAGIASEVSFPCAASPGTAQVVAAAYAITPELHAADGAVLARGADLANVTIGAGELTTLPQTTFAASTGGKLVLSLAAPPFGANCKPTASGGAGITGTTLTLITAAGSCVPATFVRSRGTTQVGTYQVRCSSPLTAPCVERDETLTASLAPGAYTIHVQGLFTGSICWASDDVIEVPLPGRPLVRAVNLTRRTIPGC